MAAEFDTLMALWEDGQRRVAQAPDSDRGALERVTEAIHADLRRRLGGRFTTAELAEYHMQHGTDWCFEIAYNTAPGAPAAWDTATVAGAAFARYARSASDWGGGLRREEED